MTSLDRLALVAALTTASLPAAAQSVPCGGDFGAFMQGVAAEARAAGMPEAAITTVVRAARQDPQVLRMDRGQSVFRQTFLEFSQRAISSGRLNRGAEMARQHAATLQRAQRDYGIPPEVILAFMALETDYGAVLGDFNTINALATLAHDCRRPGLFRPHLVATIGLIARGDMDENTTGAWAGEIGMMQMLPNDILTLGVDGDGDGRISLRTSVPDAILSGARMIRAHGWRPGEPWLQEVVLPADFPWELSGLDQSMSVRDWQRQGLRAREGSLPAGNMRASLLLPQGRGGPKFLAYPNYDVYRQWNHSFIYAVTAAYMAARVGGASRYDAGNPEPGLDTDQMMALQRALVGRGYDVGGVDGVLGAMTRAAVQAEQSRLGLPADGWPTPSLLGRY